MAGAARICTAQGADTFWYIGVGLDDLLNSWFGIKCEQ